MKRITIVGRWILTGVVAGFIYTEAGIATMLMIVSLAFAVEVLVFWVKRNKKQYCDSLDTMKDIVGKLIDRLEKETKELEEEKERLKRHGIEYEGEDNG